MTSLNLYTLPHANLSSLENCKLRLDVFIELKQPLITSSKELTAVEFAFTFLLYRDIICPAFPDHRSELDDYLSLILDLALRFGGYGFYTYQFLFASQATECLQQFNRGTYWETLDLLDFLELRSVWRTIPPGHGMRPLCSFASRFKCQINGAPPFSAARGLIYKTMRMIDVKRWRTHETQKVLMHKNILIY